MDHQIPAPPTHRWRIGIGAVSRRASSTPPPHRPPPCSKTPGKGGLKRSIWPTLQLALLGRTSAAGSASVASPGWRRSAFDHSTSHAGPKAGMPNPDGAQVGTSEAHRPSTWGRRVFESRKPAAAETLLGPQYARELVEFGNPRPVRNRANQARTRALVPAHVADAMTAHLGPFDRNGGHRHPQPLASTRPILRP